MGRRDELIIKERFFKILVSKVSQVNKYQLACL